MANWEVKSYEFYNWSTGSQTHTIMVSTITDVISGKLTLTLNDTSKLSITVPTKNHTTFEPVKTLLEVKHGNDRKFFGTVTKVTKDLVNGTMKVDAVGVLGSYQFLPNYLGYSDATNLNGLIACESQRFRGYYTSGDPHYVASPWEEVYTPLGEGLIPSSFGYLDMSTYNSMHTTCNLDKVKRNAKNAYDFLKTVTKENNYSLPTEMANPSWFKWIEDGEIALFKPISGYNDQYISYKVNLMSCSMAVSPHKTRVHCYWNDGSGTLITQDQQGSDYPNPFYYARKELPNKDDGSAYIVAEVQKACYNELHEQNALVEATAFDQHLVDNSVPWLDMGKTAIIIYYDGYGEQSAQAQITQIEYDLTDSSKDRVKLGRIVSSITDSLGASSSDVTKQLEEYLPLSGGTIQGDVIFQGNVVKHDSVKNIDVDIAKAYEPLVAYGTEISANANLNTSTYANAGLFYQADSATVATFTNCPTTNAFTMIVRNVTKTDVAPTTWQYLVREITDINGKQYIQTAFCGGTVGVWVFGDWKEKATVEKEFIVVPKYSFTDLGVSATDSAFFLAWLRKLGSEYDKYKEKFVCGRVAPNSYGAVYGQMYGGVASDNTPMYSGFTYITFNAMKYFGTNNGTFFLRAVNYTVEV